MFTDAMRTLLGDSLYQWSLLVAEMLGALWNSLLLWRSVALLLFLCLIVRYCRHQR